jgi:hypothetical protein
MESKKENRTPIQNFADLAIRAAEVQKGRMKLFSTTELANYPATPERIMEAVNTIHYICAQTKSLLELSVGQRGMYMCWLKMNKTGHGEWEKFCAEHFPDIPKTSRCRWMSAYLTQTGEKRPKELPAYEPDELEDDELTGALENLTTDKVARMPRRAMLEHFERMKKQLDKGREQLVAEQERAQRAEADSERFRRGLLIPDDITEEEKRCERIEFKFWEFVRVWLENLPDDRERAKAHLALFGKVREHFMALWEDRLMPAIITKVERAEAANSKKTAKGGPEKE